MEGLRRPSGSPQSRWAFGVGDVAGERATLSPSLDDRRNLARGRAEVAESSEHHPPVVVKVQPTFRHPYACRLKAHASYDARKRGRLVLNLYAEK
jgi:hypothetical protein